MRKRMIVLILMFIFAWTFPLTHNVQININISAPHKTQTNATMEQKKHNKIVAMEYAKAGWDWDKQQRQCIYTLFMSESKFDHFADNKHSTAYGIGQVLGEKSRQPEVQILHAYKYIEHRYSTPCRALAFHIRHKYY